LKITESKQLFKARQASRSSNDNSHSVLNSVEKDRIVLSKVVLVMSSYRAAPPYSLLSSFYKLSN